METGEKFKHERSDHSGLNAFWGQLFVSLFRLHELRLLEAPNARLDTLVQTFLTVFQCYPNSNCPYENRRRVSFRCLQKPTFDTHVVIRQSRIRHCHTRSLLRFFILGVEKHRQFSTSLSIQSGTTAFEVQSTIKHYEIQRWSHYSLVQRIFLNFLFLISLLLAKDCFPTHDCRHMITYITNKGYFFPPN
ncbi:unnamed protein product [Albugo candida]|uniref:Uncharacterized protein n=1 Tax=Albugo candida TaxID=65357 RepID=A0A024G1W3_9STRA|nr:unnamed protein product [Albugo candida]|eukprot:CCI40760.1 unnamed protein product [Albugo candida]